MLHVSELYSFLRLHNIPLYMYTRLCLSIHLLDVEWSPPFAVVNNAAMNFGVQVSKSLVSVLLCIYIEVELLDHMVCVCFGCSVVSDPFQPHGL